MYPRILLIDDDEDDQFIFLAALEDVAPDSQYHISNNGAGSFSIFAGRLRNTGYVIPGSEYAHDERV